MYEVEEEMVNTIMINQKATFQGAQSPVIRLSCIAYAHILKLMEIQLHIVQPIRCYIVNLALSYCIHMFLSSTHISTHLHVLIKYTEVGR